MNKIKIPKFYFFVLYLCSLLMVIGLLLEVARESLIMWKIGCYGIGLIITPILWSSFLNLFRNNLRNLKIISVLLLMLYFLFLLIVLKL